MKYTGDARKETRGQRLCRELPGPSELAPHASSTFHVEVSTLISPLRLAFVRITQELVRNGLHPAREQKGTGVGAEECCCSNQPGICRVGSISEQASS